MLEQEGITATACSRQEISSKSKHFSI